MTDFVPIDRDTCPGCGRPTNDYYTRRKEHMAAAFRSGVNPVAIGQGYGVSPEWAMKLIEEQLGREAVVEVYEMFRKVDA